MLFADGGKGMQRWRLLPTRLSIESMNVIICGGSTACICLEQQPILVCPFFLRIHTHKVPMLDGFVSIRNPNFFLYSLTSPENVMCVCVCVCGCVVVD